MGTSPSLRAISEVWAGRTMRTAMSASRRSRLLMALEATSSTWMPGSAARMVAMFEREQAHRHQWEQRALKVHQISTILGQLLGFFVAVAGFFAAAFATVFFGRVALAAGRFFFTIFFAIPRPPLRSSTWHVGGKAASI